MYSLLGRGTYFSEPSRHLRRKPVYCGAQFENESVEVTVGQPACRSHGEHLGRALRGPQQRPQGRSRTRCTRATCPSAIVPKLLRNAIAFRGSLKVPSECACVSSCHISHIWPYVYYIIRLRICPKRTCKMHMTIEPNNRSYNREQQ